VKRVLEFIRSVIPADAFQLFFLGGIVCLIVAHGLRWSPAGSPAAGQSAGDLGLWLQYGAVFFIYFIIFSGMAGYFVCFWPGKRPIRRVIWLVCVPALVGLTLMFTRIFYLSTAPSSVLESAGTTFSHRFRLAEAPLWKLPEGFQITLLGLILIAIFTSRMVFGIARLPVTLPNARISEEDSNAWRRLQMVIFVLVGPLFLVSVLLSFASIGIPLMLSAKPPVYIQSIWFSRLAPVLEIVAGCSVVLWLMGQENRRTVWESIRRPDGISALLSLAFPVGTAVLISTGHFVVDRQLWVAHGFGKIPEPEIGSYFDIPDLHFLLLFFGAFLEEIIFRGLLQKRFIQRYGMYRGIFFVGIVWAAFHFFSDFSFTRATDLMVLEHLGTRLFMCETLSFVLGWLTLRSKSVIPAAVAHALYNVAVFSNFGPPFPGKDIARLGLWAVLAYALFRFWPVKVEESLEPAPELPSLESAG
jgi:membrane protease YdiL (CAAX protease family)